MKRLSLMNTNNIPLSLRRRGTINLKDSHSESVEKISLSDYELYEIISKINNYVIKIAQKKGTDHHFIMKIVKKIDSLEPKQVNYLYTEYKILRTIYHPFIIQLKGINTTDDKFLYFLFELVPGGQFFMLINSDNISLEQAKFYSAIIITVMDYLHRQNIILRNICPDNIYLSSNGYIKITNFTESKVLTKSDYTNTLCGTPEYASPEMIMRKGHTKSHDIWTLGIFLYHMLIGHTPFEDIDPTKIHQKIIDGKIKFIKNIDPDAKSLIKHLLKIEPKKRIGCGQNGIRDIINDPFYKGFDWTNLLLQNLKAPYIPVIKDDDDFSNFKKFQDDFFDEPDIQISKDKDPFLKWD